jgi:universal stress protein A
MRRTVILVPTDFSDGADAALDVAARYARALGGRLCLLNVFAAGQIDVSQLLADAAARPGSDVPVTVASTSGDPAAGILRYARRHPVDLIVVGTHGHAGASRELLGHVADRVVRGARCPVLVVPAPAGARRARRRRPVRRSAPRPRQRGGIPVPQTAYRRTPRTSKADAER